ncbi:MAG: aminopeptidase [Thermoplasmata archaeon]|nr:aminopeptidase [Thermoplasmata archaeon]
MRVATRVVLSPEERIRVERWARHRGSPDPRVLRARIVLAAADGRQDIEISQELGISRMMSARWRRRFLATRIRGIDQRSSPRIALGRLPEEQVRAIVRAARRKESSGPWPSSSRSVARSLGVSHTTVRRVWEAYAVRPQQFEILPARPDPVPALVPSDVVGLYLHPPDYALALAVEPPDVRRARASEGPPTFGDLPPPFQALLQDWPGAAIPPSERRVGEFLRFAAGLAALESIATGLQVIASVPGISSAREVTRWRSRHPRVRFEFCSDLVSFRARLAPSLAAIGSRGGRSRTFGARGEFARAIRLFVAGYTHRSDPFQWIASPREVRSRVAAGRLRYDLSVTGHPGFMKEATVDRSMRRVGSPDQRNRAMARIVLRKSLRLRKGERVTIESWTETLEFANAFVLEALRIGAQPMLIYQDEPTYWAAASEVRPADLARLGAHQRAALERSDVFVSFFGPSDRERFHALPRPTMFKLGEYRDALYRAAEKAGARAVQMAVGRVSEASARMYGVDLAAWREELVAATLLDPAELQRRAVRVAKRLAEGHTLEIHHVNGTDLRLGLRQRTPDRSDGLVSRAGARGNWNLIQLPAGVVTVALDEHVAEGTFHSNVANSVGVMDTIGEVVGGRWTFETGRLARFTYEQGEGLFRQSYNRAGPGRERPGTLSIGLNDRIEIAPLLQDQAYGAVTLQLGKNDQLGGRTRTDWWAWLILRGSDLSVDGRPILKRGRIVA